MQEAGCLKKIVPTCCTASCKLSCGIEWMVHDQSSLIHYNCKMNRYHFYTPAATITSIANMTENILKRAITLVFNVDGLKFSNLNCNLDLKKAFRYMRQFEIRLKNLIHYTMNKPKCLMRPDMDFDAYLNYMDL